MERRFGLWKIRLEGRTPANHMIRIMNIIIATLFGWLAAYFFVFKSATGFEKFYFLGGMATVSAVVIILPELAFLIFRRQKKWNNHLPALLGASIAIPVIMSWLGTFLWYRSGWGYDSIVHFFSNGFGMLTIFLVLLLFNIEMQKKPLLFGGLMILIIFGGIINELFEYYGDIWWGTHMYGELGQAGDTLRDLSYNILGAVVGLVLVMWNGDLLVRYLERKEKREKRT